MKSKFRWINTTFTQIKAGRYS